MKLNKKAQGPPELLVDAMAYLTWILIILFALFLLNLDGCAGKSKNSDSFEITQKDLNVQNTDLLIKYRITKIYECQSELLKEMDENVKNLTFNELIALIINTKENEEKSNKYKRIWEACTKEYIEKERPGSSVPRLGLSVGTTHTNIFIREYYSSTNYIDYTIKYQNE